MILSRENLNARRLARVGSRRGREDLAAAIDGLLGADRPGGRLRVLPDTESLRANSSQLRGLAAALRGSSELNPEAIAALRRVLTDGTGPVYAGGARALSERLDWIDRDLPGT